MGHSIPRRNGVGVWNLWNLLCRCAVACLPAGLLSRFGGDFVTKRSCCLWSESMHDHEPFHVIGVVMMEANVCHTQY